MQVPSRLTTLAQSPATQRLIGLQRTVRARALTALRRRVAPGYGAKANYELANITLEAEVIVYFPDDVRRLYQIEQWLPIFEQLAERRSVLLVMRNLGAFREIRRRTRIRTIFVRRLYDLIELYDRGDYKIAIYVNNGSGNFQSLGAARMLHVHINHGESDKISMVSNQAKAYDRIFVAGEAAVLRHRAALMNFDESKLVRIGRPQLDLTFKPSLPPSSRRTLLYAPTWEGENEPNNYTSVDRYGPAITTALLGQEGVRVVYKPHPRVPTSGNADVQAGHQQICALIAAANAADPAAGHVIALEGDILALFDQCDAMVTDVSSVGLDFLYLHTDKPLFLTDRRSDRALLEVDAPVSACADVIDATSIEALRSTLAARLERDVFHSDRLRLRRFYFGDLSVGESTTRFLEAVDDTVETRDRLLVGRRHIATSGEAAEN